MGHGKINGGSATRTTLGICALALWLFALVSSALAAPVHQHLSALDISGLNHACGTAVDSKGDVYVSSAGESKIKVFDSSHAELTSIADASEPCGLAVDSKGNLYVSEQGTGNVVRYVPDAYPFAGIPTYGAAETIDGSGNAKGIAVDPFDDRLYVAKGDRIDVYNSDGTFSAVNEVQRVLVFEATGGTFKLRFEGQETGSLPWNANHAEVQTALEALSTIGAGNVSVTEGNPSWAGRDHIVTFQGALAATDVELVQGDGSGLIEGSLFIYNKVDGYSGHIGEGDLTEATGVAAYTYKISNEQADRYVFAADAATDQVKVFSGPTLASLKLRKEIVGPKPGEEFGFGATGAYLAADPGNKNAEGKCTSIEEQACTAGHLLVYDEAHKAVDEFEADGEYLDQLISAAFADGEPTGLAIERSGGPNDGTIYVTAGAGVGAKLLAFGPLSPPSRPPLGSLSRMLPGARAVAVDSAGDVFVATGTKIHVYDSTGKEVNVGSGENGIDTPEPALALAVDSTGKLYVLEELEGSEGHVTYYTPNSYPPQGGTTYARHEPAVAVGGDVTPHLLQQTIAVNPVNDHIFLTGTARTIELDSAMHGSGILNSDFAPGVGTNRQVLAVYGRSGDVYFAQQGGTIFVSNSIGTEVLALITGVGSPTGSLGNNPVITVDQSNGHVLTFNNVHGPAQEYEASGAFVTEFGQFSKTGPGYGIAIDNSGGSSRGNVYVAFDDPNKNLTDLSAFGQLSYGEPPIAVTGTAASLGSGVAILHGTVDPRGFELTECKFEYLTDAEYSENVEEAKAEGHEEAEAEGYGFEGAASIECAETPLEVGKGSEAVPVHAEIGGLVPEGRYHFRLVAVNRYGSSGEDDEGFLFGPPTITPKGTLPIAFGEATVRATIDPSGLASKYWVEYGTSEAYGQSTAIVELAPDAGPSDVAVHLFGLTEDTPYHFRFVAENGVATVPEPDQSFETQKRSEVPPCPNSEYRIGYSSGLPDCRAYELVTPAETAGALIIGDGGIDSGGTGFSDWLVAPRGEGAGERVSFFSGVTLPGFEGSGRADSYTSERTPGSHPAAGWKTALFGPSHVQAGAGNPFSLGVDVAPDQRYSLWKMGPEETFPETLSGGTYLRTPVGFEPLGQGSLGTDPDAARWYLSAAGAHVIFSSTAHLEPDAPPAGTEAIYDRSTDGPTEVVSMPPAGAPPATKAEFETTDAAYIGVTEDGSAAVFKVGGTLYLHREGKTTEIASAPNTFAGISEDGKRVFYAAAASGSAPAALYACDVEAGPCAGAGAHGPTEIAGESIFVNVSADGSHVYFTSEEPLTGDEENEGGESAGEGSHNLFVWNGADTRFIAVLHPQDFAGFEGDTSVRLNSWTSAIATGLAAENGRAHSPTRATPDGEVLLFQSHAQLGSYDNESFGEIYRYDAAAASGERLICVSCDPSGAPPSADASLQSFSPHSPVFDDVLIPNVTDGGHEVFFTSADRLLPEDANNIQDVYEWKARGAGGCERSGGCLALISSGQGEKDNYLFGMSADGHDVFLYTLEKLVPTDVSGSRSIYDARVGGGIPDSPAPPPCQGDACQGPGTIPPVLQNPESTNIGGEGNIAGGGKPRCSNGKYKIKLKGKVRCVRRSTKKHHHGARHRHNQFHQHRVNANAKVRR